MRPFRSIRGQASNKRGAGILRRCAKLDLGDEDLEELQRYAQYRKARHLYDLMPNPEPAGNGRTEMRSDYYRRMELRAQEVRVDYQLSPLRVGRADMNRIYRHQGIRIDRRHCRLKRLRGAYFNDQYGPR